MRAHEHLPAGLWDDARQVDAVLLDFDERHRRRILLHTLGGAELLVDLPHATRLREGDGLRCEDGGIVRVRARPEPVLDIHAGPRDLLRIAWHLGNRHLPVQLLPDALRIRADHVIAAMTAGLGGHPHPHEAPFDPEPGAYAATPHAHGPANDPGHIHAPGAPENPATGANDDRNHPRPPTPSR